jgi:hypothetical protein
LRAQSHSPRGGETFWTRESRACVTRRLDPPGSVGKESVRGNL